MAGPPVPAYDERIFVSGINGSGKSLLAIRLLLTAAPPRLVIDPADSDMLHVPGEAICRDPAKLPDAAHVRYIMRDPTDADEAGALYASLYASGGPRYVLADDCGLYLPEHGAPKGAKLYVIAGRKRQLGHMATHVRARETARWVRSMAVHQVVFGMADDEDVATIARSAGVKPAALAGALAGVGAHGYAWLHRSVIYRFANPPL